MSNTIYELNELETEGWTFKIGDVYINPSEDSHFKITRITLEEGDEPEAGLIYGIRISPNKAQNQVVEKRTGKDTGCYLAGFMNNVWALKML